MSEQKHWQFTCPLCKKIYNCLTNIEEKDFIPNVNAAKFDDESTVVVCNCVETPTPVKITIKDVKLK